MRVFRELSDEEIATLHHQRTLAVLADLHDYDVLVFLAPGGLGVLRAGCILTSTAMYQVYDTKGLLQGFYETASGAAAKLMGGS